MEQGIKWCDGLLLIKQSVEQRRHGPDNILDAEVVIELRSERSEIQWLLQRKHDLSLPMETFAENHPR